MLITIIVIFFAGFVLNEETSEVLVVQDRAKVGSYVTVKAWLKNELCCGAL